ncbi:MAG TPA: FUSC family protein [Stenotrophomonas sp.]
MRLTRPVPSICRRPVQAARALAAWLERIDPGVHRRIKGLRLVTAYGIAAALGSLHTFAIGLPGSLPLCTLAGGIALWASVSESSTTRWTSSRDLVYLCAAATLGALMVALCAPLSGWGPLAGHGWAGGEWVLISGAFLAGYLRQYGTLGTGLGSQLFIGQLLAYMAGLGPHHLPAIAVAGGLATLAAIVPRVLSGPAEQPVLAVAAPPQAGWGEAAGWAMGLQAALAALIVVGLNGRLALLESAWAITAAVYVITSTTAGTWDRFKRRMLGTLIGVPLGLACLPLASQAPLLLWCVASVSMIVYAMALPERYDVACAAFAFALVCTLAASGETSVRLMTARVWETALGGGLGLLMAWLMFRLQAPWRAARSR